MKLTNHGTDEKTVMSLTMFPLLKKVGPIKPHCNIDHASALQEFTQFITKRVADNSWIQTLSIGQREHIKNSYIIKTWPYASLLYYMAS